MKVASFFCGIGGLDSGFSRHFDVVFATDVWDVAVGSYRANHLRTETLVADVRELKPSRVPAAEIYLGGFPCQGFSNAGGTMKKKSEKVASGDDPRNLLAFAFLGLIEANLPEVVVAENVKGLKSYAAPEGDLYIDRIVGRLEAAGYQVAWGVLDASLFGVPQKRERMILVASRVGKIFPPTPSPGTVVSTIRDAIGDLPPAPDTDFHEDHVYTPWSDSDAAVIDFVPEGGSWKKVPDEKLPPRLRKIRADMRRYHSPDFYQRRGWDAVAGTMTATMNPTHSHSIHPTGRRFTVLEARRFQTIPDDFKLTGTVSERYRQVGNAVPFRLSAAVAERVRGAVGGGR